MGRKSRLKRERMEGGQVQGDHPGGRWRVQRLRDISIPPEIMSSLRRPPIPYAGPIAPKANFQGHTFRAICNRLYPRPATETFHEFILDILKESLGRRWYEAELPKSDQDRHVIMKWIVAWHEEGKRACPSDHKTGDAFSAPPSGETQSLITLAYDVYKLHLLNKLPPRLLDRLRSRDQFQGVRYEIAVAAIFARCGFDIDWIKDTQGRHCEFVANQKSTGEVIAVEAKSRHRPGVLHQRGSMLPELRADVGHLLDDALSQNPGDKPFGVFIDLNLPLEPGRSGLDRSWVPDLRAIIDAYHEPTPGNPQEYSFIAVTNFSWHYQANAIATAGEDVFIILQWSRHPVPMKETLTALMNTLTNYWLIPREE